MSFRLFFLALNLSFLGLVCEPAAIAAEAGAGASALEIHRSGRTVERVVQNRFFVKQERFQIAPVVGYVPNNPFAKRYVGGVLISYHYNEEMAFEGGLTYSPDLGITDLKGLAKTLVQIASTGSSADFQQPLDKVTLAAAFGITWAPLYGKINLVGETILNFDVYFAAGLAMLSKRNYYAIWDAGGEQNIVLESGMPANSVKFGPNLGLGSNFFVNQTMALKLDTRFAMYVDKKPSYDPDEVVTESRLYNNFVASVGVAFFFPKMKSRVYSY